MKKSYKGNEPSPKGLGWCAHAEKIGTIKVGKDGNKWIIKKVISGSKRWVKINEDNNKYKKIKEDMKEYKKFYVWNPFILNSIPYLLYINKNEVRIYTIENVKKVTKDTKNIPIRSFNNSPKNVAWAYTKFVKSFKYIKKLYDKISRGFLFELENKKYLNITGNGLYIFKLDDIIEKYISAEDDYGLIIGKKNVYFLIDMKYIERDLLPKKISANYAYQKYYGIKKRIKTKSGKFIWITIEEPLNVKDMKHKRLNQDFKNFLKE